MFKQKNESENLKAASKYLLHKLEAKVTPATIDQMLTTHPSYPSILALSESLSDLHIENIAANIGGEMLHEVPLPAIAHLKKGHFVVLEDFANERVSYFDPEQGKMTHSLNDFENQWSGVVLMAELDEQSGEKDFWLKKLRFPALIALLGIGLVLAIIAGFNNYARGAATWLPLLSAKIIGLVVALQLIMKEEGLSNALIAKVCDTESNISCGQVLDSPAAKLFGWLKMSELGLVYFAAGAITILFSLTSNHLPAAILGLGILTVLALPYTFFSVFYQGVVIRKWCVFCLAIQAIFWIEFAFSFSMLRSGWGLVTFSSIAQVILIFVMVITFWLILKPMLRWKPEALRNETKLNYFLKNEEIMQSVIESAPPVSALDFDKKVLLGNAESPVEIIMVSNPFCGPCGRKHELLETLLKEMPDVLRVQVLFVGQHNDDGDLGKVSRYLIAISQHYSSEETTEAMSFWYKYKHLADLKKKFPLEDAMVEDVQTIYSQQIDWINRENITQTPTMLFQNRRLPVEFDLENLKSYLRSLA